MPDGFVVKGSFSVTGSTEMYNEASVPYTVDLEVCDDNIAPKYRDPACMEFEARH